MYNENMHHMKLTTFLFMVVLSFISMYVLMYMMVNSYANVYPNLNQFYMAGLMTAPMLIIEIIVMRSMYPDWRINTIVIGGSVGILILFSLFIRNQTAITDKEFLKSMIPHHGAAILMCQNLHAQDPEIKDLCKGIISAQQSEIDVMKKKLEDLEKK